MEIRKMQIFDNEIIVNSSAEKTGFLRIIVSILVVGVIGLFVFFGSRYDHLFHSNIPAILGLFISSFLIGRLNFLQSKKQNTIVIDEKRVIVYDNSCQGRVYEMENIRNWCTNHNYRLTVWTHIGAFLTKGFGGCIAFNYADIKMPLRIGYGLTVGEAEELLEIIREKGWISGFQRSDTVLEYKRSKTVKFLAAVYLTFLSIGLILMVVLKEPYRKEWFFISGGFMVILVLFSFTIAIITYRQDKKYKEKMPNA